MRRELYSVAESLHRNGDWLDGMMYALPASEWQGGLSRTKPLSWHDGEHGQHA